jgi:hypothetical protein
LQKKKDKKKTKRAPGFIVAPLLLTLSQITIDWSSGFFKNKKSIWSLNSYFAQLSYFKPKLALTCLFFKRED